MNTRLPCIVRWVSVVTDQKINWLNLPHNVSKALRAGRTSNIELMYAIIRKEQVYWFCGSGFPAAIVLIRGWKAAPTGVLFSNLGLPDKRITVFCLS